MVYIIDNARNLNDLCKVQSISTYYANILQFLFLSF